ncbi:Dephospho-CoA kinase [Carpediemonas membranifera]|uniref:Dephospho-CoA kinase n=1 Tax=Carpediemonas membranifera TaxID=201153 RepID=A0A8J6BAD8_9EUKA|nr:Dephospho-CoA kinase [Carpediemonas membranifera]|eukprot:KAG9396077.1 Dephospho-CoA kinase [Carpediemonas membranifera]
MRVLLLTGGIATGKSSAAAYFRQKGIHVIDSDVIARQIVEPGKQGWKNLQKAFGTDYFHDNKTLNREKLGSLIFSNPDKRRLLDRCTHPVVYKRIAQDLLLHFILGDRLVVVDIPLLIETKAHLHPLFLSSPIIVVSTDRDTQLKRLMLRNDFNRDEAENRINSQLSLETKIKASDILIDNNDTLETLHSQLDAVLRMQHLPSAVARSIEARVEGASFTKRVVARLASFALLMNWPQTMMRGCIGW